MPTKLTGEKVAILGLGTMGRGLAKGMLAAGLLEPGQVLGTVAHADRAGELAEAMGFPVGADNVAAARAADVVLLCVKPAKVLGVLAELRDGGVLERDPLLISIAAGVSTAAMEKVAGEGRRIVRAMPNTPCLIGEGMTVVSPGSGASAADEDVALAIFRSLGRALRLDEEHMNAVTGLSASGTGFVYVIIEALSEGGVMMGLPRAVAIELASQTLQGAARMVLETGRHPAALKDDVTTPAGCTISALLRLEDGRIRSILARGVQEAAQAAAGLGGSAS